MRVRECEAILLDVVDLQEKDRIVEFVTAEFGKKKGVARGARRKFSKYGGQLLPLARVNLRWFEKQGRDLVRIEEVSMLRPPGRLHETLELILVGSYLAEHIREFGQDEEADAPLFRLLESTLVALAEGCAPKLAARYFETWVLRLGGIFPPPSECPACLKPFDEAGARLPLGAETLVCIECSAGGGGLSADRTVLAFLNQTSNCKLATLADDPPTSKTLGQVERICAEIRRGFLNKELRSYSVMQRTLSEVGV